MRITPIVTLRQFHSNLVIKAAAADANRERPRKADGAITAEPGLLIAIQTADCIPVLVADRKSARCRGIPRRLAGNGEAHCRNGRRTDAARVRLAPRRPRRRHWTGRRASAATRSAKRCFRNSSRSSAMRASFSARFSTPTRCARNIRCCFLTQRAPGHSPIGPALHLDLIEANRRQLLDAGVRASAHQFHRRMHELPHGFVLFAPRIARTRGTHDECDRNSRIDAEKLRHNGPQLLR